MNTHAPLRYRAALPLVAALCALTITANAGEASAGSSVIPSQMTAPQIAAAERIPNLQTLKVDKGLVPSRIQGDLGAFRTKAVSPDQEALSFLSRSRELFRASGRESLHLRRLHRDTTRHVNHYRMQQTIDGLEVIGAEMILHVDESTSRIISVDANFLPDTDLPRVPAVPSDQAIAGVLGALNATNAERLSEPRLAFARSPAATGHLVWVFKVRYIDANGRKQEDDWLIDAITGELVQRLPQIYEAMNREVRNYSTPAQEIIIHEGQLLTSDPAALNVFTFSADTYNYFASMFGRDSPFGDGRLMRAYVHGTPEGQINAVFSPNTLAVYFGDGDGIAYAPFSNSRDVVGHEWTHAVNYTEAGLVYSGESGALSESMADIFGAMVEASATGGVSAKTWMHGEDNFSPFLPGDADRYLDDPTFDGSSRDFYPDMQSDDDVHRASGIGNLAFYLLANGGTHPRVVTTNVVNGIGVDHAARIFYAALTISLFPNDQYIDAATKTAQIAQALYGVGSAENFGVCTAWLAVGIRIDNGPCVPPAPPAAISADTSSCPNIGVTWSPSTSATSYTLRRAAALGTLKLIRYDGPNTSYVDSLPKPFPGSPPRPPLPYTYYIAACNTWGCSEDSAATARIQCP